MFQDEDTETEMLAKHVTHIDHCFLEPDVDDGITAHEVMGITVDKDIVA